ncbi:hypothetical protein [Cohnella herbarum]|uniref:Uncharacterized protein n=1 Tax=Cohnella herbarum TaxID=2728023 RepID=A0A7Z2ZK28_9BACL|nr:hypothetical protein [Cohnella herbarum]QJD82508.1 hypothetical protein HH215_04425 [Cohnella herbarum]
MNSVTRFRNIAISALLLFAVATPIYFASAANGPMVKQYVTKMGATEKHIAKVNKPFALMNTVVLAHRVTDD